ncbi:general substrate transporter [Suillus fuscotomentosus]|uniref:General substrate transporter n=1 Tax=Suillus fuscotomentosus TaxID=1912939 RepID=A0AAD4E6N3_9AGAM|nr:general substrate transporter [Suillus fuscotomentosus]KAG1900577.1 general substrate transporter [Suillus fuscotomentosus]
MLQPLHSNSIESKQKDGIVSDLALVGSQGRVGFRGLCENKFLLGVSLFSTLGGFLCGYALGVLPNVLAIESFGAKFPEIYTNAILKIGRRVSIICDAVIFILGSLLQACATSPVHLFAGRVIAGLAVGSLTHVVPMYLAEISCARIRGSLVSLQQLAITFGILVSYGIVCGTSQIGGTRCAPGIPYTGTLPNGKLVFNPDTDVPPGGCTGQTQASWRAPLSFQILPALCLAIGMLFMPYSPRWLAERGREVEALDTLTRLRRKPAQDRSVRTEFLEIMAEVRFAREVMKAAYPDAGPVMRIINKYLVLMTSWPKSKRLMVGCLIMTFQQNMGVATLVYFLPTIFSQLGLNPDTTSLLANGAYGIVNMLANLLAIVLVDRVGRRPVLISGAAGCLLCLAIIGSIVTIYGKDWPAHVVAAHTAIVFVFLYDAILSYSWAPMGWVITSEIFPLHLRSSGMSITASVMWSSYFTAGLFAPTMLNPHAGGIGYWSSAAFSLGALLSAISFIPETKGRTLEEMDPVFRDNATDSQRELKEGISRELGLPDRAFLNIL